MYRRPNLTEYFSPSPLSSSSNPNSSITVQFLPSAAAVVSPMSDDDDLVVTPSSHHNSPSPSPPQPSTAASAAADDTPQPSPPTVRPASGRTAVFPAREDCWSEAATHTLIEAWGSHYLELKRGNLRQKHWQEVANAVNALHGHTKKQYRTDIQCKNRIDTLKKKYKIEKARVSQAPGRYVSTWPFFNSLDALIGPNFKLSPSPVMAATATVSPRRRTPPLLLPPPPSAVPVGPRSKRPAAATADTVSRRNFSAMAAAAAAASEESDEDEESETSSPAAGAVSMRKENGALAEGYCRLADAIGRFAEIYERVEDAKQRQMVELEKQRMQFAKDLEVQRMKLIMESQVHLEKRKRTKRTSQADGCLEER